MNYYTFGGLFTQGYCYVDLNVNNGYVADSLFVKREIPVKFKNEMAREGEKYRFVFCRIPKKYRKAFEEALEELKTKMNLLGHTDYEDWCDRMADELEWKKNSQT